MEGHGGGQQFHDDIGLSNDGWKIGWFLGFGCLWFFVGFGARFWAYKIKKNFGLPTVGSFCRIELQIFKAKKIKKMVVQIEVPDSVLSIPQYSRQDLMLDLAVALFQRKIYSLAKAARFAGLNRMRFQRVLAERQIPIPYDLEIDLQTLSHPSP